MLTVVKMNSQFDVENIDESLLDLLCEKNNCTVQEESVLDLLCKKNESSTPDESPLDKMLETFELCQEMVSSVLDDVQPKEDKSSILESTDPDILQDVYRDMLQEDGGWHNQEYAIAEVERRLNLRKERND